MSKTPHEERAKNRTEQDVADDNLSQVSKVAKSTETLNGSDIWVKVRLADGREGYVSANFPNEIHSNPEGKAVQASTLRGKKESIELQPSFTNGLYGDGDKNHGFLHNFLAALGLIKD